jgi:outer membrane protein assembly factor BamB
MVFSLSFKRYTIVAMVITFALAFTLTPLVFAQDKKAGFDWYQWRGPNRDGISSEKGWKTSWEGGSPKKLWVASVGIGYSAVSISKGKLYTMGNNDKNDTVYCFDANTGELLWKYSYHSVSEGGGHPGPSSTPTVDNQRVYTLSREGELYCFEAETGKVIWYQDVKKLGAKPPTWWFDSSPLIFDGMAIVDVGMTIAFDKVTGKMIWKSQDYEGGYSSPYAYKQGNSWRIAVYNGFGLVVFEPKTGKEIGKQLFQINNRVNVATPIVSNGKAFVSSGYGKGCALIDVSTGNFSIVYENKNMKNHFNSCVLFKGYLYGFDDSEFKCMDFLTGTVKWSQKGLGKSSLMIADGKLIIQTEKGELVIAEVSPESYKEISRAKVLDGLCWTVPVLSNGRIYCRNHEGDLVCLDVKGK